ncbi:MAG TPA: hypothetical protein VEY32_07600 [Flavisolibacter sp.]|nr:hypothetical protein [Flavisolibacter sp.]
MSQHIEFTWNGKVYKGSIVSAKNGLWWIALDNGNSYLLAIDEEGWFCPSLKRPLAALIGEQLSKTFAHRTLDQAQ